jgi:CheY-like chemotaxis protein
MNENGRILIADDEPSFLEMYQDIFAAEGYTVHTVTTRTDALRRLDEPGWGVILVDQKLQGPGGPDTGLDLIAQAQRLAPGAKAILITAYASNEAVERAFRAGAYDYIEKKGHVFDALLRVKVRNAMEAVRERWLASLDQSATEQAIRDTWASTKTASDRNRKGALLEQLVLLLFQSVPGLNRVSTRISNEIEEIDVLVQNNSVDPFWQKESPYIAVECKNWSARVGTKEVRDFRAKMEGRYKRCRLGFFVAAGGFADSVRTLAFTHTQDERMVVFVGPGDLDGLVGSADRGAYLKELHQRTTFPVEASDGDPTP